MAFGLEMADSDEPQERGPGKIFFTSWGISKAGTELYRVNGFVTPEEACREYPALEEGGAAKLKIDCVHNKRQVASLLLTHRFGGTQSENGLGGLFGGLGSDLEKMRSMLPMILPMLPEESREVAERALSGDVAAMMQLLTAVRTQPGGA